ncbi:taperin isoform X2 [Bombina bombina]|uniref:taperin isoform X2 n=1 Tax=Bombina bombina TaxID=8345 RepID=UPI00235A9FA5|nr:taperin isoform X2 [Bombina bombina]
MAVSGTKTWARPVMDTHSGKMPPWKREMMERKRAKMGAMSAVSSRGKDSAPAAQEEKLVLHDSLGPLHENPFIKLEKERRRRRPQQHHSPGRGGSTATPIRQLLDLYSHVPGIRTIRAENIIIIESDPSFFEGRAESGSSTKPHADPMEELLAKRGNKVTEIRASEVVIYEPDPSIKEKGSFGLDHAHTDVIEEAGRVSRLLEKFDHGHSRPVRSRSWENLLEKDSTSSVADQQSKLPMPISSAKRPNQAPLSKAPKRSGEISPSSSSFLDEDSKRFPLNNPSWLPSKPPAVHLPDPSKFHKRPSSPLSPVNASPTSPSYPLGLLSSRYESSTDGKIVSPGVATFRERFESVSMQNNQPMSKLNVSHKNGNTFVINPKAANTKVNSSDKSSSPSKDHPPLINGHVELSDLEVNNGSTKVQDLLSKSKKNWGTISQRASDGHGQVPSSTSVSSNEISKVASFQGPKSVDDPVKSKIPPKASATQCETNSYNHCDPSLTSATPNQKNRVSFSTSTNDTFEIRPAEKPDITNIPDNDVQAKALANIRMQSKNSFVFVPKKRQAPSIPNQGNQLKIPNTDKPKVKDSASTFNGHKEECIRSPNGFPRNGGDTVSQTSQEDSIDGIERYDQLVNSTTPNTSTVPALLDFDWKSGLLPPHSSTESHSFTDIGAELEYFSSVHHGDEVLSIPVTKIHDEELKLEIPVTNIDDIVNYEDRNTNQEAKQYLKDTEIAIPSYRPHSSLNSVRFKGGNTFTVVPKRKPVTEQEALRTPVVEQDDEDEEDDGRTKRKSTDGTEAPYSELGAMLKKRYPTVDEIQVIGGYLSLSKSCLSKVDSTRKKMKISFNEKNIHTMFEYPSENSLAEDAGEEESNEVSGSESEEDEKPLILLPRPTFVNTGGASNALRANAANSGLSSYTPKHSVEYSKWQEKKYEETPSPDSNTIHEDMLTPADSSSHSDFRSEPALYF